KDSKIGRYHSWAVSKEDVPECLHVTALDPDGVIMAMRHATYDVRSVQFHPESVLSSNGKKLIANWLAYKLSLGNRCLVGRCKNKICADAKWLTRHIVLSGGTLKKGTVPIIRIP